MLVAAERSRSALDEVIGDDDDVAMAAITVAELLVGVKLASGRRRQARSAFVERLLTTVPVLDYDLEVARSHADLLVQARNAGRPSGAHDLVIAATAAASRRIVVTADRAGFDGLDGIDVRALRDPAA